MDQGQSGLRAFGRPKPSRRAPGRSRRLWATLALGALLASGLTAIAELEGSPAAQAAPVALQQGELVVNGTAESGTAGWSGTLVRSPYGTSQTTGYPPPVVVDGTGAIVEYFDGGTYLFHGSGGSSTATQTISLAPSAAAIDNGNVVAKLSVYIGGFYTQLDRMTVTYTFFDGAGNQVRQIVYGPVTREDRGGMSGFRHFGEDVLLPVGTRSAQITLFAQRNTAPANDGYADNISLILDAPLPTAAPDAIATDNATQAILNPLSNDTPGAGAALDPTSVWLEDSTGAPVRTLTTIAGEYVVNPATGVITFTPVPDFSGTGPDIVYRFTDTSGQPGSSAISTTVTPRPAPAISLVKSVSSQNDGDFFAGQSVTFAFEAENTGNVTLTDVVIADDLAQFTGHGTLGPLICAPAQPAILEPDEKLNCTASYTLQQEDIDQGSVFNRATVSGTAPNDDEATQAADVTLPAEPVPGLSLEKTVDSHGASRAGDVVDYGFTLTNTGNVTLSSAQVQEEAFGGSGTMRNLQCPDDAFAPGDSVVCTAEYAITQADVDRGVVTNAAGATAHAARGDDPRSNTSEASFTIAAAPAMTLLKEAASSSLNGLAAGQRIGYTFTVTNTGNVSLHDLRIVEGAFTGAGAVSEPVCPTLPERGLQPGEGIVCTADYELQAADLTADPLSNSAVAVARATQGEVTSPASTAVVGGRTASSEGLSRTGSDGGGLAFAGALLLLGGALLIGRSRASAAARA